MLMSSNEAVLMKIRSISSRFYTPLSKVSSVLCELF